MVSALALNLVLAVVLVSGWALAVRAVYKRLAEEEAGRDAQRLPVTAPRPYAGGVPDAVPAVKRAA